MLGQSLEILNRADTPPFQLDDEDTGEVASMAAEFGAHPIVINLHPYTVKERLPSLKFLIECGQNPEVILTEGLFSLGSFSVSSVILFFE